MAVASEEAMLAGDNGGRVPVAGQHGLFGGDRHLGGLLGVLSQGGSSERGEAADRDEGRDETLHGGFLSAVVHHTAKVMIPVRLALTMFPSMIVEITKHGYQRSLALFGVIANFKLEHD